MLTNYRIPKFLCLILLVFLVNGINGLVLRAYISQHGLHGEIEFSQKNETLISIRTNLKPTLQYPDGVWRWTIHEYAVDYRDLSNERCSEASLGKELIDLTEELGYLIIPGKDHAEYESTNSLTGPMGLWGKSIVLENAERDRVICASIFSTDKSQEQHAQARFTAPVAGTLNFRWLYTRDFEDSYIQANLYHIKTAQSNQGYTSHKWKLFVTDIFDSDKGSHEDNCNVLQLVFDPENSGDGMSVGDLDSRFGLIKVATNAKEMTTRILYKDEVLNILRNDMQTTRRNLYVVIFDSRHTDSFLACAKLRLLPPKHVKALINMDGIKGTVEFTQTTPFEPTWANFQLGASNQDYESNLRFVGSMLQYSIRELPPKLLDASLYKSICNTTGHLYNPSGVDLKNLPPAGMGTQDQYPVGDLLGKYKERTEYLNHKYLLPGLANELSGAYWDVFLPLAGRHSVVHRALVLTRREPKHELCATILPYEYGTEEQTQMSSAQVVFRYPLVGRVVFRQPLERPWEDTTIIVESLVHADGAAVNNTFEHRWALHEHAPGRDYYNWTARCVSAGGVLPQPGLAAATSARDPSHCPPALEALCELGDLTSRHGTLSIAGKKAESARLTRRLFTDGSLALAGRRSIRGRALVLHDDHGPVARGDRLACSVVTGMPRRKAVVRDWFGNGFSVELKGKIEMTQQSEYDVTNVEVSLEGLHADVRNYKIHVAPIEKELEFPCEKTTIYDTYNPFNVDKSLSPPPTTGTADQYELGDLGDKYGLLDDMKKITTYYNETQISLFGPYSILGRSVAIHKKAKDRRWACSSVERGYSPSEARELRAIASFHHPGGFARGYVRLTQLVHGDGGASDTLLEVKLRYPGQRDTNLTHHHNWEIFVNPVGVDAAVQVTNTRCVAGGYRWNPYFTQLADPLNRDLYNQECGADNPLRCDVGDLTARLGTISIGGERQMFVDSNLPLEGTVSALGRSIVIFGPERSPERFACANILPDKDIIKFVNIMKPPRFVLGQFLEEIRRVMGVPEWMVGVDSRRTRVLHQGACVQILLHFTGPEANRLELDFTRLLASGRLDSPSIAIPGYVDQKRKRTVSYRQCSVTDPNEKNDRKKSSFFFSPSFSSATQRVSHFTYTLLTVCAARLLLL